MCFYLFIRECVNNINNAHAREGNESRQISPMQNYGNKHATENNEISAQTLEYYTTCKGGNKSTEKAVQNSAHIKIIGKGKNRSVFIAPSVEQVKAYCVERGNGINAERFVSYYEAVGWVMGKTPISDWRAAVRVWETNSIKDCPIDRSGTQLDLEMFDEANYASDLEAYSENVTCDSSGEASSGDKENTRRSGTASTGARG